LAIASTAGGAPEKAAAVGIVSGAARGGVEPMSAAADKTGVMLRADSLRCVDQKYAPPTASAAAPAAMRKTARRPELRVCALPLCWRPPRGFSHDARLAVSLTGRGCPPMRCGSES
jgi:hypothetical protein